MSNATLDQLLDANDVKYDSVEAYGTTVRIGSLCSTDMIEWLESNDDKIKSRLGGIRLIVKSFVDDDGNRLPGIEDPEKFEALVTRFAAKDATSNGKLVKAVLELNGLRAKQPIGEALKNDSGETSTGVSPTDSASK